MSKNQKLNAGRPRHTSSDAIAELIADSQRVTVDSEFSLLQDILRTPEGKEAFRKGVLYTDTGRELVRSEFGITIVDKAKQDAKPVVCILIPTHKKPENETGMALDKMIPVARQNCHLNLRPTIASSVVHWVRNQLLSQLYKSNIPFDYVLFMDDDMTPPPNALTVLLERKVDVIGAACTVRQDPPLPNVRHYSPESFIFQTADIDREGLWKVGAVGTGFMLISKKALDAVGEYTLSQQYWKKYLGMSQEVAERREKRERARAAVDGNQFWFEFLKHPLGDGEYGEDLSFCFKARECGFDIFADSTFQVGHIGNYGFGLGDYWAYRDEAITQGKVVSLDGTKPPKKPQSSEEKISILVPTRGRPENMRRLVNSISATAEEMPEVIFYIDEDDRPSIGEANALSADFPPATIKKMIGPRICLSQCWNECAKIATGDILMHGGDDIIFKTKGWDALVRAVYAAYPDKILFVHGDDGHWGAQFGTHGFIHRRWMETVGYFVPPYFSSDFNDTWLNDVANRIGRRRYIPFITDHLHPIFGKAAWDQTHKDRLERHKKDRVDELYAQKEPERKADAEKLRAVMQEELVNA